MAMSVPKAPGFLSMLKDCARSYSGIEEAVIRNIEACDEFVKTLETAYGPRGLNKMVINHLDKLMVTSDAVAIISQLDINHPAVKLMVQSSSIMEKEVGDGTNFVMLLAGALLKHSEELLRIGLKPTEIVAGYKLATTKTLIDFLPELVVANVNDVTNVDEIRKAIRTAIMSKQYGNEDFITDLVIKASLAVYDAEEKHFNVDNVRVCKILGAGLENSQVVNGMVFKKLVEGDIMSVTNAKVVIYTCPFDVEATETKGTVLLKSSNELKDFRKLEEKLLESQIQAIANSGAKVVVSGGKIGDLALHYLNKYKLMVVRFQSKYELRRLAQTVQAKALVRLVTPSQEDLGFISRAYVDEIGGTSVVIFEQPPDGTKISTVVVRGSTTNQMDDVERTINDGINTFKVLGRDGRLVAGAGACEIELSQKIAKYAETFPGLEQYPVKKFAQALQSLPVVLASNGGINQQEILSLLLLAHREGSTNAGVDVESDTPSWVDSVSHSICDLYLAKHWGIKYASDLTSTILCVDQIICAKPTGGPKSPQQPPNNWDDRD